MSKDGSTAFWVNANADQIEVLNTSDLTRTGEIEPGSEVYAVPDVASTDDAVLVVADEAVRRYELQ